MRDGGGADGCGESDCRGIGVCDKHKKKQDDKPMMRRGGRNKMQKMQTNRYLQVDGLALFLETDMADNED